MYTIPVQGQLLLKKLARNSTGAFQSQFTINLVIMVNIFQYFSHVDQYKFYKNRTLNRHCSKYLKYIVHATYTNVEN